jgi:hypothetical protein
MVSIDLHTHHAYRALSVSDASGMPHLPKSMVKSEADQADKGYFILALSFPTCLQQLSRAMVFRLSPPHVNMLCSPAA